MKIADPRRDPVVIASYARTPMGGFQGVLAAVKATELGAAAVSAAVERAGSRPATPSSRSSWAACCRGPGPGAGPPGGAGRGLPKSVEAHDGQQDVRLGHAGRDAGARRAGGRLRRRDRRRRHGEHDQRAVPADQAPRRRPHRPRPHVRPHVPRRPGGRLRAGPADGRLRRGDRAELPVHAARRRTTIAIAVADARQGRDRQRRLRPRDRAGHGHEPQGRGRSSTPTSSRCKADPPRSRP